MDWCFSKTWYEWLQGKVNKKPEDTQIQKAGFTFLSNYKQHTIGFSDTFSTWLDNRALSTLYSWSLRVQNISSSGQTTCPQARVYKAHETNTNTFIHLTSQ